MPDQKDETYFHQQSFSKENTALITHQWAEFEDCTFKQIDLSDSILSDYKFINCIFTGCNLSMAKVQNTAFRDVVFTDCKMLGLRFDTCNTFGFSIQARNCQMDHTSFFEMNLRKTLFNNARFIGSDFSGSDLSHSVFDSCELTDAIFDNTNLSGADFTSAFGFVIDPAKNQLKKAKFSIQGLPGLLANSGILIE